MKDIENHRDNIENISQNENNYSNELIDNLDLKSKIKVSEFLRVIDKGYDNVILYHTLFGMPTLVNRDILKLLDLVKNNDILTWDTIDNEDLEILQNNYFIVDEIANERQILKEKIEWYKSSAIEWKEIRSLDLLISEACNFWCSHCIYFNSMESWDSQRANKLMSFEQAKNIIENYTKIIVNNDGDTLDIHFGAAEPLLNWKNLSDIVLHVEKNYPKFNHKFSINTNLSLLTEEIANFLKEHSIDVHVSLDWMKESNDLIRVTRKGEWTFDLIMSKIELLKSIDYPITGISLTITNKNYDFVDIDFIYFCKNLGLTNIAFDIDLLDAISLDGVDINTITEKMIRIYKKAQELWIDAFWTRTTPFNNILNKSVLNWEIPYFCSAVKWKNLAVSRNWETTTCSYTTTNIGNINNIEFWVDSKFWDLINTRTPWVSEYCMWCEIEWHCAWQCHVTKELSKANSDPQIISTMCEYYKSTTKLLLENLLNEESIENNI